MENVGALVFVVLLLVGVGAGLWFLARSGEQSRLALEKEQSGGPRPQASGEEAVEDPAEPEEDDAQDSSLPLREALVAGLEVPGLDALPAPSALRAWPREPRSWPLGSTESPLPLLQTALDRLELALPVQPVDDDYLFVPAERVEATGKALGQAIARASETVALLERLERETPRKEGDPEPAEAGTIEQALKGGTELSRLSPAVDVARLIHILHARATAAGRPTGESLFVRIRASAARECLRRLSGEAPPPEARSVPRCAIHELQVLRGRLPAEEETPELLARAEAAFRAASSSTFFPSSRPVLLLLAAALQKAGLLFELKRSAESSELVWLITGDEVNGALHALEAAAADSRDPLLKKDAKDAFLAALTALEQEKEEARVGGKTSDAAALRVALDTGRLPAEPTPAIEVAAAVRTLMLVARDADRHKDDLLLLPRRCDLSAE